MSATPDKLCSLPPPPPPGCCAPAEAPPAAPLEILNAPGLSMVRYRIGTFTSFRRAMLDRVADPGLMFASPNPFAAWHEGTAGDYQTLFIELWAYLADILTFYQERIANEAFLPTATQRDSLLRLVRLIDYRPAPGSGASGLVAFTAAKDKVLTVPLGFRVGSRAKPPVPAGVFETSLAIGARAEHSAIPLSAVAPTNQFAQLSSFQPFFGLFTGNLLGLGAAASNVYGSFGAILLNTFLTIPFSSSVSSSSPSISPAVTSSVSASGFQTNLLFPYYNPFVNTTTRKVVLKGVGNRLAPGDYVVVVENQGTSTERATPFEISTVAVDKPSNTTTVSWQEPDGTTYQQTAQNPVTLYALRVKASPFGSAAPKWASLPAALTNIDGQNPDAPYQQNWDVSTSNSFYVASGNSLLLDGTYDDIKASSSEPGWVVLKSSSPADTKAVAVTEARPVSATGYATTAKVTRLALKQGSSIPASVFPFRDTVVLASSEKLALENNLPIPDPVQGATIILAGLYPNLAPGQTVILEGNLYDSTAKAALPQRQAEARVLGGAPVPDRENNITTVTFTQPLTNRYARAGMVLMANVAPATQGETVKNEVLGSGNGAAFQSFALKNKPLTYLPSTDPEGLAAVAGTLTVTVNGVRWNERPNLLESAPDSQDFTTRLDDTGQTKVEFGDGDFGARPPTGRDNIRARYRKGLGVSGNVSAGGVQQLIDSIPGLLKVTNPLPFTGGADQESIDRIRTNAPASLRTFGRAVSAADYAAVALSYPGIAKASAAWLLRDVNLKALAQPYVQLTVATADQTPLSQQTSLAAGLRSFLDARRDPNVPLRILDYTPVYIDAAFTVDIDDRFPRQATYNAVWAALNPGVNPDGTPGYFAFERQGFGQGVHLSAVYAAVQAVPGVADVTITTLRRLPEDAADSTIVRNDILIRPTELAVLSNNPAVPLQGQLLITLGQGGFLDT